MGDNTIRLLVQGAPAGAPPITVQATPAGTALEIVLPASRKLVSAQLQFVAAGGTATALEAPALDSDAFTPGADGKPDVSQGSNAHWLSIDWGRECALTALTLKAPSAKTSAPASGARVRMFSAGQWLPLPPRDTLGFGADGVASARFPPCAASRLMVELLTENKVGGNWSGVLVPGAVDLSKLSVSVQATPQPCHVSLAVGDEAPFFQHPGPLPLQPVAVDGFSRALNRWLVDHPGSTRIPLTLRAAAPASLRIAAWAVEQEPAPGDGASSGPVAPPPPPPRPESPGPGPLPQAPAPGRGRWCDPGRAAAQGFRPTPPGLGLSALELQLRNTGAVEATGTLALHADAGGAPAATPLAAPLRWQLPPGTAPAWLRCELPLPAVALPGPWWAVLRVEQGELIWYEGGEPVDGIANAAWQADGGAWIPLGAQSGGWLASRLWWLPAEA
ncbi:hypothetical protein [Azohydromonas caseinilytica]|uniref:Uncharacterized protein n=1 Tax=Azohydromonas caseinilytica TaxID=2728836 RepID=A0A848F5P8_9BURK|nr:hypothetical protein [Azohydromonas caseinilytica]NML13693.1 hypothetical protein [Azohydromonas caseinilytica]